MEFQFENYKRILITGGLGFIGSNLVVKLLKETKLIIYNLDKLGYASDDFNIESSLKISNIEKSRYCFLNVDLFNFEETKQALQKAKPDLVIHLAAESHVDRSILNPNTFIESNIVGTYNLLQSCFHVYSKYSLENKNKFRFLHVSTDEVFGSLGKNGLFCENSKYDPRSPYSASKAASDHLVKAWFHTYKFPILVTNCGNNFGPWQFPEKLIPTIILNALKNKKIPIYGNGSNIRDWIYVHDHINALLHILSDGKIGDSYNIGSTEEKTNLEIAILICSILDNKIPQKEKYCNLIDFVTDRPGHDQRYAINASKLRDELGWAPKYEFNEALKITVYWYLKNIEWCKNQYNSNF